MHPRPVSCAVHFRGILTHQSRVVYFILQRASLPYSGEKTQWWDFKEKPIGRVCSFFRMPRSRSRTTSDRLLFHHVEHVREISHGCSFSERGFFVSYTKTIEPSETVVTPPESPCSDGDFGPKRCKHFQPRPMEGIQQPIIHFEDRAFH